MALLPGKNDGFENLGEVIAAFALRPSKNYAQKVKYLIIKSENIRKIQHNFFAKFLQYCYILKKVLPIQSITILCRCSRTLQGCVDSSVVEHQPRAPQDLGSTHSRESR